MFARRRDSAGRRSYQEFNPSFEWVPEKESYILVIQLPDFKKEEVRLQLDTSGNLKITGERNIEENKWIRFLNNVSVPPEYDRKGLRANFENGVLRVTMPKKFIPTQPQPEQPSQKTSYLNQQMNEKVSEPIENQKLLEKDQEQISAHSRDRRDTGEESEKYESAEECADGGATRMKDGSPTRMVASGMGRNCTRQMIINVIVDAVVLLALVMYIKYNIRSSCKRATDN